MSQEVALPTSSPSLASDLLVSEPKARKWVKETVLLESFLQVESGGEPSRDLYDFLLELVRNRFQYEGQFML